MNIDVFNKQNELADNSIKKFNKDHAGQERLINSTEKGIVKGLNKHLSINGKMQSTPPFKDRANLPIQIIIEAKFFLFSVSFDDDRLVMLPVFYKYNPPNIK